MAQPQKREDSAPLDCRRDSLRDENRSSSALWRHNALRSAGRSPTELDDERLREAPRTQQAPSLRDATGVGASAPLPDGLRPPERLYFHPNKEQRANDAVRTSKPGMVLRTGRDRCGGNRIGCMRAVGDEISFREKMASRRSRRLIK